MAFAPPSSRSTRRCSPGRSARASRAKALAAGIWSLEARNIREHGIGAHRLVDDTPAGGGAGMVMRADVLAPAIDAAAHTRTTAALASS